MKSSNEYMKRAAKVKKEIDSGKLKGLKLQRQKKLYYSLRFRAKHAGGKAKPSKRKVASRPKAQAFNPEQGFLPSFLKQMNMVRVEELVAEKLFRTILGEPTDQTLLARAADSVNSAIEIAFPSDRKKRKSS